MLRQYGPDVPEHILRKLVLAFGELRDMADQGLINYPYSTREVVNMVRHLQVKITNYIRLNENSVTYYVLLFTLCVFFLSSEISHRRFDDCDR